MKNASAWQLCKSYLTGSYAATMDTPGGRLEGLHEARVLKDHRVRDFAARWKSQKAA